MKKIVLSLAIMLSLASAYDSTAPVPQECDKLLEKAFIEKQKDTEESMKKSLLYYTKFKECIGN